MGVVAIPIMKKNDQNRNICSKVSSGHTLNAMSVHVIFYKSLNRNLHFLENPLNIEILSREILYKTIILLENNSNSPRYIADIFVEFSWYLTGLFIHFSLYSHMMHYAKNIIIRTHAVKNYFLEMLIFYHICNIFILYFNILSLIYFGNFPENVVKFG